MNITVLGFGHVGSQLAQLWSAAGHKVQIGLRPGSKYTEAAKKFEVLEPRLAVKSAEVIALAVPWQSVEEVLRGIGPLDGKVLMDATNPLNSDLNVMIPKAGSAAQQIAEWAPKAKVVKAFNTIGAASFGNPAFDMYYCGDDAKAAEIVHKLIADTRMRPVNVGPLKNAGYLEQLAGLWVDLTLKGRVQGTFGFNLVKEHGR